MLYSFFRIIFGIADCFAVCYMFTNGDYEYAFFLITILLWCAYSFFREDDNEYLIREGIDPEEISWYFPQMTYEEAIRNRSKQNYIASDGNINYTQNNRHYSKRKTNTATTTLVNDSNASNKLKNKVSIKITVAKDGEKNVEKL